MAQTKTFPGTKVGDILYAESGDCEDGVEKYVVVQVDVSGYVLVISCDPNESTRCRWAQDDMHASLAEALRAQANEDINYHAPRVKLAERILKAIRDGADLTEFEVAVDLDSLNQPES